MALIHFLVFFGFCVACWWVIHWLLKRYVSSKPWHRWVRYAVWAGCIGLLTFDSIYYQVAVVHGMCEADKKRTYPAPPASLVVVGPYSKSEVEQANKDKSLQGSYWWPCTKISTKKSGECLLNKVVIQRTSNPLKFGMSYDEWALKNIENGEVYLQRRWYNAVGQWVSKKIFGFGIIWVDQPEKCKDGFWSIEQPIYLD